MPVPPERPTRLLFVVNVDWFFMSHRLPLARAARDAGAEVIVAAGNTGVGAQLEAEGIRFIPLNLSRHGTNATNELRVFLSLIALYRRLRPDIFHHVTIKPVLYGSVAARLCAVPAVVNAVSGLGSFLTSDHGRGILRATVNALYRAALSDTRSRTIFQNPDDRALFELRGFVNPARSVLIRGSGVDCALYRPAPAPDGLPVVMLPSRMLWDKGVATFVEAARLLAAENVAARCVLVGDTDDASFMQVPRAQLQQWQQQGVVEWWGAQQKMHEVLPRASIVVLPSRREGLPKVLLEAAACGRAMIATDVPGCREVVHHEETGLLVPFGDARALADAIRLLVHDHARRERFGAAARALAERDFAEPAIVAQTLAVYRELMPGFGNRLEAHAA